MKTSNNWSDQSAHNKVVKMDAIVSAQKWRMVSPFYAPIVLPTVEGRVAQMRKFAAIGVFTLLASSAFGDSELSPYPSVTSSEMGTCYFKQVPSILERDEASGKLSETQPAYGVAYRLEMLGNGAETEMWRTSDWYSFQVFITDTCDYLVRMGNWSVGRQPSSEDLAVAFYSNGRLLKEYSTADLVKDFSSVLSSVSHYIWQAPGTEYPRLVGNYEFHLITTDQIHYVFDVQTGLIKEQH